MNWLVSTFTGYNKRSVKVGAREDSARLLLRGQDAFKEQLHQVKFPDMVDVMRRIITWFTSTPVDGSDFGLHLVGSQRALFCSTWSASVRIAAIAWTWKPT